MQFYLVSHQFIVTIFGVKAITVFLTVWALIAKNRKVGVLLDLQELMETGGIVAIKNGLKIMMGQVVLILKIIKFMKDLRNNQSFKIY